AVDAEDAEKAEIAEAQRGQRSQRGHSLRSPRHRKLASTDRSIAHVTVRARPASSSVMSSVGAKAGKSKMNLPPPVSSDCVTGFTALAPRLTVTPAIGFFAAGVAVTPTVMRVRCASA